MKARQYIACVAVLFVPVTLLWVMLTARQADVPLYSAATVMTGLREHPEHWFGRTVAVRGIVRGSVADQGVLKEIMLEPFPAAMVPPSTVGPVSVATQPLTIVVDAAPRDSVQALVQRIPVLSGLLGARQVVTDANGEGTYRIKIADASNESGCALRPCYVATGLDPVSGIAVAGTGE